MAGLPGWHKVDDCDLPPFSPWYSAFAWLVRDTSLGGLSIGDFTAPLLQKRYTRKSRSL